jgi:hypothetical protein
MPWAVRRRNLRLGVLAPASNTTLEAVASAIVRDRVLTSRQVGEMLRDHERTSRSWQAAAVEYSQRRGRLAVQLRKRGKLPDRP